jgi:hypothetical protein
MRRLLLPLLAVVVVAAGVLMVVAGSVALLLQCLAWPFTGVQMACGGFVRNLVSARNTSRGKGNCVELTAVFSLSLGHFAPQ